MLLKILNLFQKPLMTLSQLLDNFLHKVPLIPPLQPKPNQHLIPLHRSAQRSSRDRCSTHRHISQQHQAASMPQVPSSQRHRPTRHQRQQLERPQRTR